MTDPRHSVIERLLFRINARRLIGIYAAFFLVEAVFLFYVERNKLANASGEAYDIVLISYILHLILALTTLGYGLFFYFTKDKDQHERLRTVPYASMATVLIISATIGLFDQITTGFITLFTAHMLILGLLIFVRPYWHIPLFTLPFLIFLFGLFTFQEDSDVLLTHLINGGAVFIGVTLTAKVFYDHKVYGLMYRMTLKSTKRKLARLSTLDPLTHLPNRRHFKSQVTYEVSISRRYNLNASFLLLDIDFFKQVNDTYGHEAGDRVLVELAGILKENVRDSDTVARFGGEEFMLLLSHTDIQGASILASRLRNIIEHHVFLEDSLNINITVSIGVTPLFHNLEHPFKETYLAVDRALYEAKEGGRNKVVTIKKAPHSIEDAQT
jgi:diguanylate cyclase (GGDEF)-like protein